MYAELVLVAVAVLLLVGRLVRAVRQPAAQNGPTYPDPDLKLDVGPGKTHDVFGELDSTLSVDHAAEVRYLRGDRDPRVADVVPVSRKIVLTALCVGAVVAIPYAHPSLAWLRLVGAPQEEADDAPIAAGGPMPTASIGEAKLPGATFDQQARASDLDAPAPDTRGPIAQGKSDDTPLPSVAEDKPPRSIEGAAGLDKFFAKLTKVDRKEGGTAARVLYFGDSIVASDFVSGKLRRSLQDRFGDAGHGYAIIANAWPGWFHIDVFRQASSEWRVSTCVGPYAEDGLYGLGCATFTSHNPAIWSEIGTADVDKWGRAVSRFEVEYLKQPGGGAVDLSVDGEVRERLETDGAQKELGWKVVEVPDGAHKLRIESVDERPVRLFGVRMERDVPGVTLSAMGITGARARFLDKQDDEHWRAVLRATKADLVCLAFGSNEITDGNMYPIKDYKETLGAVMKQVEEALPDAAWMLVGPPDMASSKESQGHTRPLVHFIVEAQRELATERGWAFWDQYRAMGGGGSMWSWIKAGLGSQDMFHPTGRGGNVLGKWEYLALMEAYEQYKARQ
jgi:GDSL-like lipase/acylhydrolase family protein